METSGKLEVDRTIVACVKFIMHNYCDVQQMPLLHDRARLTFLLTFPALVTGMYETCLEHRYCNQSMLTITSLHVCR
jgi:hypothetical protein